MNVYIAGPMRGYPQFNFPAFFAAEDKLKKQGYKCFNPARRDVTKYGKKIMNNKTGSVSVAAKSVKFSLREALAADTKYICKTADAIALLPGWYKSKGARAEHALAKALGLKILKIK